MIINPIIPIWIMVIFIGLFCFFLCRSNKKVFVRQLFILVLLFIINLRVMIPSNSSSVITNDLDVLFVIDTTISMAAFDHDNKTRLEAVKEDCKYIIDSLEGAKFSIVSFDDISNILVPYTRDKNMLYETLEVINVANYNFASGTSLNVSIDNMLNQLKSSSKNEGRARIVFFISDGEITDGSNVEGSSFSVVKDYVSNGAVLGYGTTTGGYMKVYDSFEDKYIYVEDKTSYPYVKAVSKIDEKNLNIIADNMGLDYINMNNKSDIDKKLSKIKKGVRYNFDDVDKSSFTDTYFIFVIPLLCLFIYEFRCFKKGVFR